MDFLPKPDVILTHESDLDGFVAGLLLQRLARKLFDADAPLEAYSYNGWKNRSMNEQSAWVCDFSFEPRLDRGNWLIVDHHATEVQPKHAHLVHDLTKSAGLLCYEICRRHDLGSPALDRVVHLNNIADLFLAGDPDFALANDYANLVKNYQFWNLHEVIEGRLENLLDHPLLEVMAVKRRIEDPLGVAWSKKHIVEITPAVAFVDTVIGNNNLIIHQLLESGATPYAVLITMLRKGNNVIVASFRSRNGEALPIAEKLQGGGHANACGATLPRSVRSIPEAIDFLRRILDPGAQKDAFNTLEEIFAGIEAKQ